MRTMRLGLVLLLVGAACAGSDTGEQTSSSTTTSTASSTTSSSFADPSSTTTTAAPARPVTASATAAAGWALTPIGVGVKPVLAQDGSGSLGMAWLFERVGEGFVAYATAADDWAVDVVTEGYFYGPIDVAFDPAGTPHIAYHDHQADDFDLELGDLTVATLGEERWTIDAARDEGHDGWDSAIVIDADGVRHAAGVDPSQFGRVEGVEYYVDSGDGWEVTEVGSGPIAYAFNVSLALNPEGLPVISYYNDIDRDLMLATFDGTDWTLDAIDTEGDVGKYSSLAFDDQGRAHVSYYATTDGRSGTIRYASGGPGDWTIEDVADIDAVDPGFARRNSAVRLDSTGMPHVVFSDITGVWYATPGESGWEQSTVAEAGDLPLGQLVSFVLDDTDTPHIAFYEVTLLSPLDGVVLYTTPA